MSNLILGGMRISSSYSQLRGTQGRHTTWEKLAHEITWFVFFRSRQFCQTLRL